MAANGLLLMLFIAIGVAIGVLVTRRSRAKQAQTQSEAPSLNREYFAGLNFLLNEEPDKALEVFLRMVEVDNDTVETHLALGSLYRRRGEVDRAIRIHENIMARQSLKDEHREHAMFALGEDYFRAGLFDRAEQMFQRLIEQPGRRSAALRYLLRIYEQQADWEQAIATHRQLLTLASPPHPTAIAHYYCELAEQARERGERDRALQLLRDVRAEQRNFARSALIRADVAWDAGDRTLAARLCQRVVELHPQLLPLVLQRYVRVAQADGDPASAVQNFRPLVRPDPAARAELVAAGLVAGLENESFVLECLPDFIRRDPNLGALVPALAGDPSDLSLQQRVALASALARILKRGQRYRCVECGLPTATHFWQCPGCRSWDTLAPASRLELTPVPRVR
jgi:lipopolysaccharide biosynthesis regulator YciM